MNQVSRITNAKFCQSGEEDVVVDYIRDRERQKGRRGRIAEWRRLPR